MTQEQLKRLRELEHLEYNGVQLSEAENTELCELINLEDAYFRATHQVGCVCETCSATYQSESRNPRG